MAITLTERAASHVNSFLAKRGKGVGLRLGVRTSGCSGLAYRIEYADAVNPDVTREGLNEGFKFNNPNVRDECGCGESFNV